jgi:hypothetical protein
MQHVYLGAPLDAHGLPPFCTDSQEGCYPFRSASQQSDERPVPPDEER